MPDVHVNCTCKMCFIGLTEEEDDDDVCDEITSENFNFCFKLCTNNTLNTVDVCVS